MEVIAIAVILWVLGDTISRGRLQAAVKGTAKGTARTGTRAARAAVGTHRAGHRAYLASGRAPLGRTRLAAGDGARALGRGGIEGARAELAKLREDIARARQEMERARRDAQDPAHGVTRGKGGRSFDQPPRAPRARTPRATDPAPMPAPTDDARRKLHEAEPPQPPTPTPPAAPATGPTERTTPTVTTMSTGATNGTAPAVEIRSVPGFILAVDHLSQLCMQVHEGGIALGIGADAQAGLQDAADVLRGVAQSVRTTYTPLVEAADATPQGAGQVTVAAARTE